MRWIEVNEIDEKERERALNRFNVLTNDVPLCVTKFSTPITRDFGSEYISKLFAVSRFFLEAAAD
jgi:hypothetical protein